MPGEEEPHDFRVVGLFSWCGALGQKTVLWLADKFSDFGTLEVMEEIKSRIDEETALVWPLRYLVWGGAAMVAGVVAVVSFFATKSHGHVTSDQYLYAFLVFVAWSFGGVGVTQVLSALAKKR